MSVFIRALIDAFAPLQGRLRYEYRGEGGDRVCVVTGLLRGEREPHIYTSPPLKDITPKKSPLWTSDRDRQLAYYGSRAWGRLYCAGILHGVYDPEELEGDVTSAAKARDVTPPAAESLRDRLAKHAAENGDKPTEGFKTVEAVPGAPQKAASEAKPTRGGKGKPRRKKRSVLAPGPARPPSEPKQAPATPEPEPEREAPVETGPIFITEEVKAAIPEAEVVETGPATVQAAGSPVEARSIPVAKPAAAQPKPPTLAAMKTPEQYRDHVASWLPTYDDEAKIEERWSREMGLRNQANVTAEIKAEIRASLIDQRIAEIRS